MSVDKKIDASYMVEPGGKLSQFCDLCKVYA